MNAKPALSLEKRQQIIRLAKTRLSISETRGGDEAAIVICEHCKNPVSLSPLSSVLRCQPCARLLDEGDDEEFRRETSRQAKILAFILLVGALIIWLMILSGGEKPLNFLQAAFLFSSEAA